MSHALAAASHPLSASFGRATRTAATDCLTRSRPEADVLTVMRSLAGPSAPPALNHLPIRLGIARPLTNAEADKGFIEL